MSRQELATQWAQTLNTVIAKGVFGDGIRLTGVRAIAGPRCGAVEMLAGIACDRLFLSMNSAKRGVLRQTVPWPFHGEPIVYFSGPFIRAEAGWPKEMAQRSIPLESVGQKPDDPNRWITGKNENGVTIIMSLDDKTPHVLVSGMTGSGKSTALVNAIYQLSQWEENEIVLLCGKYGDTLRSVEHLSAYPIALNHDSVRNALGYALGRIQYRIQSGDKSKRTILFFDEFQTFMDDKKIASLLARLAQQGRSGNVNMLLASQHPTVKSFGGEGSTGRCLPASLAFMVRDHVASRVAVGGPLPRADFLLGEGDGYTVTPSRVNRILGTIVSAILLSQRVTIEHVFDIWPEPDWEALGELGPVRRRSPQYTEDEIANGILSAKHSEGRPKYLGRFDGKKPGSARADTIMCMTRNIWERIQADDQTA